MRYIECPECQGKGEAEKDKTIVGYINCFYIDTEIINCGRCDNEVVIEDPYFNEVQSDC